MYSNRIRKYLDKIKWKSQVFCRKSDTSKRCEAWRGLASICRVRTNDLYNFGKRLWTNQARQSIRNFLSYIKRSEFWNNAWKCCCSDMPPEALQSIKRRHFRKERNVSCSLIKPNVRTQHIIIERNFEWSHLVSHAFYSVLWDKLFM
jgi:hypothetical protein